MEKREQWTSKIGFILAAAGSAIGLGAIWKFPYETGSNGGSVFILMFIVSTIAIGLPILLAEFVIGRRGQADAVTGLKKQAPGKKWFLIGWSGFFFSFMILSFYSVVGGWILSYLGRAILLQLSNLGDADFANLFNGIIGNPLEVLIAQALFMFLTIWIVQGGVQAGIERASKIMMPALLLFFLVLMIRSLTLDGAIEGVKFMLVPLALFFQGKEFILRKRQRNSRIGFCGKLQPFLCAAFFFHSQCAGKLSLRSCQLIVYLLFRFFCNPRCIFCTFLYE